MFPSQGCAFARTKAYLLLKRQFKNNTWTKAFARTLLLFQVALP